MPAKLTILGSGSAVPNLIRGVSGQYLNFNERRILIDCGEGTQLQLRKRKIKFQRIQYIFISHLHGDHFLGIFGLLSSMSMLGRDKELTVFGPKGLEEIVRQQFKLSQVYLNFELKFVVLTAKGKELIFEDNIIEVYTFPLKHRVPCYGFLFQEKQPEAKLDKSKIKQYKLSLTEIVAAKRWENIERENEVILNSEVILPPNKPIGYAYCTDTKFVAKLPDWIKGTSLLYHEATFATKYIDRAKITGHSTAAQAAEIARLGEVGQLLLGHFSSRYKTTEVLYDEAKAIFSNVTCVEDGDEYLIS